MNLFVSIGRAIIGTDETAHGPFRAQCTKCFQLFPVFAEFFESLRLMQPVPPIECTKCAGFRSTSALGVALETTRNGRTAINDADWQRLAGRR